MKHSQPRQNASINVIKFIIIAEKTPASVSGEMNRQKVRPVRRRFVLRPHTGH